MLFSMKKPIYLINCRKHSRDISIFYPANSKDLIGTYTYGFPPEPITIKDCILLKNKNSLMFHIMHLTFKERIVKDIYYLV